MDYSILFEEKYKETFQRLESFVNHEFESSKENDEDERDFRETYNEVRSKLEEWRSQQFETSTLQAEIETYNYFTSRNKVTFPEFLFPGVLERKTKKLFLEKHTEAEYFVFIEELAENKAYQDVIDIVNNYDKYFDLVYRDKWEPINFSRYDQNYESADYFLILHKKIWPQSERTVGKTKKDYSQEMAQTKQRLKSFTEEEKVFLIKLFFDSILSSRKGMDKTELMKFALVTAGIKDVSIFYKQADYVQSYTLLKKSYDHFSRIEEGKFFQILINKLDSLGLKTIKAEIKILQSKT